MKLKSLLIFMAFIFPHHTNATTYDVFDNWKVHSHSIRIYIRAYAVSLNEDGEKLFYWCIASDDERYCSGLVDTRQRCKYDATKTFILTTNGKSRAGEMTCGARPRRTGGYFVFDLEKIEKMLTNARYDDVISLSHTLGDGELEALNFSTKGMHQAIARVNELLDRHQERHK